MREPSVGRLVDLAGQPKGFSVPADAQPFLAEHFTTLDAEILSTAPKVIVEWQVPANHVAFLEAFSVLGQTPHLFYESIFDLAVDGKQLNNLRFVHLTDNTERPPNFVRLFSQNQKMQLRVYRRYSRFGLNGGNGGFAESVFGRISGKTWMTNA